MYVSKKNNILRAHRRVKQTQIAYIITNESVELADEIIKYTRLLNS